MSDHSVEAEVQKLSNEWATQQKEPLYLSDEQRSWLYKAVHIFQAHEKIARFASQGDKILTEAMVRYVEDNFEEHHGGTDHNTPSE